MDYNMTEDPGKCLVKNGLKIFGEKTLIARALRNAIITMNTMKVS